MSRITDIISGLRAHQAEEGTDLVDFEIDVSDLAPPSWPSTITNAAAAMSGMIVSLTERKSYVQTQLDLYNEEMRQINHVLNYAEPALAGIEGSEA